VLHSFWKNQFLNRVKPLTFLPKWLGYKPDDQGIGFRFPAEIFLPFTEQVGVTAMLQPDVRQLFGFDTLFMVVFGPSRHMSA
jgi:hypothetical protein